MSETRKVINQGTHELLDEVKDRVSDVIDEAKDQGEKLMDKARERGQQLLREAQGQGRQALKGAGGWIRLNPGAAVGIAFAAGVVFYAWLRSED